MAQKLSQKEQLEIAMKLLSFRAVLNILDTRMFEFQIFLCIQSLDDLLDLRRILESKSKNGAILKAIKENIAKSSIGLFKKDKGRKEFSKTTGFKANKSEQFLNIYEAIIFTDLITHPRFIKMLNGIIKAKKELREKQSSKKNSRIQKNKKA